MTAPVALSRIHHVAYRCKGAKATADWYVRVLGMEFTTAFAEDHVPSTGEYDPYMHIFLDCGGGNVIAFFELPNQPDMGKDPNTPAWSSISRSKSVTLTPCLPQKPISRRRALMWSGRHFTGFSGRSISLIPTATGWSLHATSARPNNMPN